MDDHKKGYTEIWTVLSVGSAVQILHFTDHEGFLIILDIWFLFEDTGVIHRCKFYRLPYVYGAGMMVTT